MSSHHHSDEDDAASNQLNTPPRPSSTSSTSSPLVRIRQANPFHSSVVELYPSSSDHAAMQPPKLPKFNDLHPTLASPDHVENSQDDHARLMDATSFSTDYATVPPSSKLLGNNGTSAVLFAFHQNNTSGCVAQFKKYWFRNLVLLTIGAVSMMLTIIAWNVSYNKDVSNLPINISPGKDDGGNNTNPSADTGGHIDEPQDDNGNKQSLPPVTLDDIFQGTFYASRSSISWCAPKSLAPGTRPESSTDGEYFEIDGQQVVLTHIETGKRTVLVDVQDLKLPDSNNPLILQFDRIKISADRMYVLVETKRDKHWRHSYVADYIAIDVKNEKVLPVGKKIQAIKWAPVGHSLTYVRGNNVYVAHGDSLQTEVQLSFDGSDSIMNGVPDWVYEEEVLLSNEAIYWSADAQCLSWIRFNDTSVPVYSYPYYYNPATSRGSPYPAHIPIRYPKPGYLNPLASLFVVNILEAVKSPPSIKNAVVPVPFPNPFVTDKVPGDGDANINSIIIADVAWVGTSVLVKLMNRIQNQMAAFTVDTTKPTPYQPELVRHVIRKDGWIENQHQITPVVGTEQIGYLDMVIVDDSIQIGYFPSVRDKEPVVLTQGNFEVVKILGVDPELKVAYLLTTQDDSTLRTLVSVPINTTVQPGTPKKLHPEVGYYNAQFSTLGKYYWLSYEGPDVPWQAVYSVQDPKFQKMLQNNDELRDRLARYAMPNSTYVQIPTDHNVTLNAVIHYPPEFNKTSKYPVLMRVYGGPNSQIVHQKHDVDFHTYLASNLNVICVMVDGRGTGFRGRKFRMSVYRNLGELETADQISAAKWLKSQAYVHSDKMVIWGWSYGGYVSGKVAEANTEHVFKAVISVAPVTDWRFYDSVYTERYMSVPSDNLDGYKKSRIQNMDGFKRTRYLLLHGTGDDNVHLQQSINLIRKFQIAGVHSYRAQVFPDSDHSMNFANGYRECYMLLDRFLRHIYFASDEFEVLEKRHAWWWAGPGAEWIDPSI